MSEVVALVLPFFGLVALGYAAGRLRPIPESGMAWLNFFIVYVALPCLFFNLLSRTPVEDLTNWGYVTATTVGTLIAFLCLFLPGLVLSRGDLAVPTIQGLAGAYGNIGYMGPGIALLALGPSAAVPVALVFCFDNTLHFVVAPLMMALSRGGERVSALRIMGGVLRSIFTHPFILATIVGVAAAIVEYEAPLAAQRMIDPLAAAAAPCALFAMGVSLALRPVGKFPPALVAIVPTKLLIHPFIVWAMLMWLGPFDPVWVQTAVLLAALPCATNVFVIAQQYDVWVNRASAAVLVTTVASIVTVTGLLYAMQNDLFPIGQPELAVKTGRLPLPPGVEAE